MNINKTIDKTLKNANKEYHEAYECKNCAKDSDIERGIWTSNAEIGKLEKGGLPHYYDGDKTMLLPYAHTLVIGSTGTGKTEVFNKNCQKICANIPDDKKPMFLITDAKGETVGWGAPYLQKRGYITKVLDMRDAHRTARHNPLTLIFDEYKESEDIRKALGRNTFSSVFDGVKYKSVDMARSAAESKMFDLLDSVERAITEISFILVPFQPNAKEQTWTDGARTMVKAILWTMLRRSDDKKNPITRESFTLANLCRIAFSTDDDCEKIVSWLEKADDIMCVQNAISSVYNIRAKTTRDGYISTLNTSLGEYASRAISAMTATSDDIDIKEIARCDKPYAIFIVTDDRQKTTNSICMIFINNLLNELMKTADYSPTHSLARDFVILADEFANMPALPNITNKITTLRSRRIWMVMSIQSLNQLEMVYGKESSVIIKDNCDIHMFLGCNNDDTKVDFARSMGQKVGVKTAVQIANDGNVSISKGTENVPVVRKSDLDSLKLGEFYVRSRTSGNFKSYMMPHFMQKEPALTGVESEDRAFRKFDQDAHAYNLYEVVRAEKATTTRKKFDFDF